MISNLVHSVHNTVSLHFSSVSLVKHFRMATDEDKKNNLLLLFERPQEPVFMPKGPKNQTFNVPNNYLPESYQTMGVQLVDRFSGGLPETIHVEEIPLPDLGEILSLGRRENFSLFIPKHRRLAGSLIKMFMSMPNIDHLTCLAVYSRDQVNPFLFNYALSVALLHRPETQDLDLPTLFQSFPDKFIDSKVCARAREETFVVQEGLRSPIEIPRDYTASNLEVEHRLAYFREDIGINLAHWHWHLVYPPDGDRAIVNKDRRGELFYYMHQQMVARYNQERLCNRMKRVVRWTEWKDPIEEAYFPKLDSLVASRSWPARVSHQKITNINREDEQIQVDVDDLIRWRERIYSAIHSGIVRNERGENIVLTENEGIDVLGNVVEASDLSPNPTFYGDLHNMGHVFIAYIHDPDNRHLESFGVMGDSTTAMRDPMFYRWHAFIDDLFQEYKATLPRYPVAQLNYPGITVSDVTITTKGEQPNTLHTFWQQSDVDLSRGLDFQPRGNVFVRFTHLQHQPFVYTITVNNRGSQRMGTCRIFLAPKHDERGNPWIFREQKNLFVELDKFTVDLQPGTNTISRNSSESSVTIPFERTFRQLDLNRPTSGEALSQFNFCGCGWPHHMLIPRGSSEGYQCQLFVMISNYDHDKVEQSIEGTCSDAASYCGIKNKLYPDKRSMGFPFDRQPRDGVDTLHQFLTPNMRVQDCVIILNDQIINQ